MKKRILISGAGLAGLSLYLVLDKSKFDVDIVEKKKKTSRLGYAINFMPNGVRALRKLGFKDKEIGNLGRYFQEYQLRNKEYEMTRLTDYRPFIKKYDNFMVLSRRKLYRILEKRIKKNAIKFGIFPEEVIQKKESVLVKFNDKTSKEYDLVIGADGVNSSVRKIIFPKAERKDTGLTFMWAWVPRKKVNFPRQEGMMGDENGGIGFFDPGEKSRVCLFFFVKNDKIPADIAHDNYKRIWAENLKGYKGPVPKILKNLPKGEEMHLHRDYELNMEKWYDGSIVLIGDAAHARSVITGFGSALAIEDAVILGNFLNNLGDIKKAIKRFNISQVSRVNKIVLEGLIGNKINKTFDDFLGSSILFRK